MNIREKNKGFSLVELSITLVIVGLLISGMISGFATYRENSLRRQAQEDLKIIHDALIGFAIQRGRLPCPDSDPIGSPTSGIENRIDLPNGQTCTQVIGFLPHRDLGVSGIDLDPWGLPYVYSVDLVFADDPAVSPIACPANNGVVTFGTCDQGTIEVHDIGGILPSSANCDGVTLPVCNLLAENIPAIFYSVGANGFTAATVHEQENLSSFGGGPATDPNDTVFVSRQYANRGANHFDDQVMWLSPTILIHSMVKAGRLP